MLPAEGQQPYIFSGESAQFGKCRIATLLDI